MRTHLILALFLVGCLAALLASKWQLANTYKEHLDIRTKLVEQSQAQVNELLQMNNANLLTIQANFDTIQQLLTPVPPVYTISHYPFPGNPWILEVWWPEKLLWVPLVAYYNRTSAEDVKARLERGEVEERFLVR